ncbi:ferredoxin [Streptomyces sp. DSM 44915]|uniref:Ferredoxin n=1 Tax=Streptomyces chisholmiae TaxID=3075540 RepID=A0ABU2JMP6_9ACTN|nr:ferredoxin [Streptomyces sp. DSM 44915]MDT0266016.1 ferredoxin [Streptomyces sp. DSM 44915]
MQISLDQDRCVASGQCVMAAPEVFDQREEDGIAILLTTTPSPDDTDNVRHATAVCPALAIQLTE